MRIIYPSIKRVADFAFAFVAIIFLFPVSLALLFLVRFFLGAPVLFAQNRIGLNEKPFLVYKFRTMTNARDSSGNLLPDKQRLTRFGKFLRSTSLDELPQLWCVLKGDLSLVGPRPLLPEYLPRYSERQRTRHSVIPGITGWAQINGRNNTTWEKRLECDAWYVENRSFLLDLHILFRTFVKVLARSDISAKGEATMPAFQGTTQLPEKENP